MNDAGEEKGMTRDFEGPGRPVVYCLIPLELAPKLHDLLRDHFADAGVEVVVEQRGRERRSGTERRSGDAEPPGGDERRKVRGAGGRRAGERRAAVTSAEAPELPRRARRYAERLSFIARVEPSGQRSEDLDTARLVARIQAGDGDEGFAKLYQRYFGRVYGYLRIVIGDTHEAEDLAQQVFVDVLESLPGYQRRSQPFRAWLFTVVRNRALMHLRRHRRIEVTDPGEIARRQEAAAEPEPEPEISPASWIQDRDLLLFVERLPLVQRQALVMRYVLDMTSTEIAPLLDMKPDAVRALLSRAVRLLEQRLAAIGRGPSESRRGRTPMRAGVRQAPVLRHRRFALRGQ